MPDIFFRNCNVDRFGRHYRVIWVLIVFNYFPTPDPQVTLPPPRTTPAPQCADDPPRLQSNHPSICKPRFAIQEYFHLQILISTYFHILICLLIAKKLLTAKKIFEIILN